MTKLLIYGLGDLAKMMRYLFEKDMGIRVVAFCADNDFVKKETFDGLPLVPFDHVSDRYPQHEFEMFLAVGYSRMRARKDMFNKAINKGYKLVNYISPLANVDPSVTLGVNNAVFQGTQIEPFCAIGDNNIIWSSVNISHEARIGSHCFIASQSLVGGKAKINDGCFLGFNSTIIHGVVLGTESLIGAKSLVLTDTEPFSKNIGSPAKLVGYHVQDGAIIR